MKLPARTQTRTPGSYERAALRAMTKGDRDGVADGSDGSRRLLRYCRAAKRFGFLGDEGVRLVRIHLVTAVPLPRDWSDEQIKQRLSDADVEAGEACEVDNDPVFIPPPKTQPRKIGKIPATEIELNKFAIDTDGFLGEYITHHLDTAKRPQPIFALVGGIALTGALIGRKVRDEFGTRPNVQLICVGKTASGKDHARALNNQILSHTGNEHIIGPEEFTSDTAVYRTLADGPSRLIQLDEFGRFLHASQQNGSSHTRGVVTALMKCFTSAGLDRYCPKSYANKKDNPDIVISHPHLVLLATSTPEAVYEAMGAAVVNDGFLGRCFVFASSAQPRLQMTPERVFSWTIRSFCEMWRDFDAEPIVATSPDAVEVFIESEEAAYQKLISEHRSASLWGRLQQKSRQLALISAASHWDGSAQIEVSGKDARWACGLAALLTTQMVTIADEWLSDNAQESAVQRVLRTIRTHPNISQNQLTRKTQWLKSGERTEIIETLIVSGQIGWESKETTGPTQTSYFAIDE